MTNQFVILFTTIAIGTIIGRIKIKKASMGMSGILVAGLIIGWAVYSYSLEILKSDNIENIKHAQSLIDRSVVSSEIFTMFLVFFVAAVGLQAFKNIKVILKKYGLKFMFLSICITLTGAVTVYMLNGISGKEDVYQATGIFAGALTSSPGLASAIEKSVESVEKNIAQIEIDNNGVPLTEDEKKSMYAYAESSVGSGYALSYPIGVLTVMLFINLFPKIFKINIEEERRQFKQELESLKITVKPNDANLKFDMTAFFIVCSIGYIVGMVKVNMGPLGYIGLGSTGAVLLASFLLGSVKKIGFIRFELKSELVELIRDISASMFMAIVGLRYGYQFIHSISGSGVEILLIAFIAATASMVVGFAIGRGIFKFNWLILSGAICGGMTSTPGLGFAIESVGGDEPSIGYGATYPFALISMILFNVIMHMVI